MDTENKICEAADKHSVLVALRIRPLMQQEIERGWENSLNLVPGEPQVQIKDLTFTYNFVFPEHITQQEFYDTSVKGLIGHVFEGYNVTILAYGQTGSGKTYTMGTNYTGSDGDSTKLGVIPQAVSDIFEFIEAHEDKFVFRVNVSYLELYQEQCYDLLSGKERGHSIIEIREDVNKGVILPGITVRPVSSTMETLKIFELGSSGRVTGSTAMNQASSRSHAVFTIIVNQQSRADENLATTSKFHLVDLAGSERFKKTCTSGLRLKEGVKINQGLFALGNVISKLCDGTNKSFISYRDSKLTRLLQDSLGGNSLTLMVACVSPADYNLDETVSTLRYADRARRIRNKPIINQDAQVAEILRLNNVVNELRLQLKGKLPTNVEQNNEQHEEELEKERNKYQELLKKYKFANKKLSNMVITNTNLCEKALLAEAAKNIIDCKLNLFTEQCNQTIDNFNTTARGSDDDLQKTSVVDYLSNVKTQFEDLQTVNMKADEEMIDHEIKQPYVNDTDLFKLGDEVVLSEDQTVQEEEKRLLEQVAISHELKKINKTMAMKSSMLEAIRFNSKDILVSINEEKIAQLEKELDDLQQLKTKPKDPSHEDHRTKVTSIEQQISDLKKTCQQQAQIIQSEKKNGPKIAALNAELQTIKATKIKLVKQMREANKKFLKWKADNELAILRRRSENSKCADAMAKMETLLAKQQNALKRKMEETMAVNMRLKEALDRQKFSQAKCKAKGSVEAGAVQQYIEQELEVHLSIVEAEKSLQELMEYRALITAKIEDLRHNADHEVKRKKITELEQELALRKAQISDLQQKILTADKEKKISTQWDNIQSMPEAIVALKCLFKLLVNSKRELLNQSEKGYQARYEEIKEAHDRLAMELQNNKTEYERQLATVKLQNVQKLQALVTLQRGLGGKDDDDDETCKQRHNVIQCQQELLAQVEGENAQRASLTMILEGPGASGSGASGSGASGSGEATARALKRGCDGASHCTCCGACSTDTCGCFKAGQDCDRSCHCLPLCKNRRSEHGSLD